MLRGIPPGIAMDGPGPAFFARMDGFHGGFRTGHIGTCAEHEPHIGGTSWTHAARLARGRLARSPIRGQTREPAGGLHERSTAGLAGCVQTGSSVPVIARVTPAAPTRM